MKKIPMLRPRVMLVQKGTTYLVTGPKAFIETIGFGLGEIVVDLDQDSVEFSGILLFRGSLDLVGSSINGYNVENLQLVKQ